MKQHFCAFQSLNTGIFLFRNTLDIQVIVVRSLLRLLCKWSMRPPHQFCSVDRKAQLGLGQLNLS